MIRLKRLPSRIFHQAKAAEVKCRRWHRYEKHAVASSSAQVLSPVQSRQPGTSPQGSSTSCSARGRTAKDLICGSKSRSPGSSSIWSQGSRGQLTDDRLPWSKYRVQPGSARICTKVEQPLTRGTFRSFAPTAPRRAEALVHQSALTQQRRDPQDRRATFGGRLQGLYHQVVKRSAQGNAELSGQEKSRQTPASSPVIEQITPRRSFGPLRAGRRSSCRGFTQAATLTLCHCLSWRPYFEPSTCPPRAGSQGTRDPPRPI